MKFNIVDSIMGSGKSNWAFDYMYQEKDKKFIYITPYLDEIDRLLYLIDESGEIVKNENGYPIGTKWFYERGFREPKHLGEGKLENLHDLLTNEKNIATTHALFKMCTQDTLDLIADGNYTLILDEALDVVELIDDMKVKDYNMLIDTNKIEVNEDQTITWLDKSYDGIFWDFRRQCENGTVVEIKKTQKVQLLIWNFNFNSFSVFKDIYIMTYLFEASLLKHYFDIFNVQYKKWCIEDDKLVEFQNKKPYDKSNLRRLINIYDGKMNDIGDKKTALCVSWYKNKKHLRPKLKKNIYNFFKNISKTSGSESLWTTFKSFKNSLTYRGYKDAFVSCSLKATNKYKNKTALAYCVNRFLSPDYVNYFNKYGIKVDQDMYALSEMIQWIWRSAIRDENPIYIYIPSKRMRTLLVDWLNNENL
ncbi:MAG TPA: hypothetical protein GX708_04165 [Gallicola sp.]|nr:hypothetical protein [Gallicola sp.]